MMAKTEQIVTDRKTMKQLVEFMEEAVREGLTSREINSQVDLLLDEVARGKLEKSLREARSGKMKRYKNTEALLKSLHKSRPNTLDLDVSDHRNISKEL